MIHKNLENQARLKKIYTSCNFRLKGVYFDKEKNRYIKINNPPRTKYIKKRASKIFRRYKDLDLKYNNTSFHKKTFGVLYEIW